MATFGQAWRSAAAMLPGVPPLTVRAMAQDAWKALADSRQWGWRRRQGGFRVAATRDLDSVAVTANSSTVTSVALFLAGDVGRQFRTHDTVQGSGYPIYTVIDVPSTSAITLDRPFLGDTNADIGAQILDAYVTVPANFQQFLLVVDTVQQCRIGHWYTQEQLSMLDPVRTNASDGSPRGLFAADYSPLNQRLRYEVWPYSTSGSQLPYWYTLVAADLADEEELPGPLRHRSDILELGARIEGARYAGTPAQKNPGYDLALATQLDADWRQLLRQLEIRDDDQYAQDLVQYAHWPLATQTVLVSQTRALLVPPS
jgi:hypothetical protein